MIVKYECVCETCGASFTRSRSDKLCKPRFCTNKCKFAGRAKSKLKRVEKTFTCQGCGVRFTLLLKEFEERKYCTHRCAAKHMYILRGQKPMVSYTVKCEGCGTEFTRIKKQSDPVSRFCSRKCAAPIVYKTTNGYDAYYARWSARYGEEVAQQMLEEHKVRRSKIMTERNTGRKLDASSRKKISDTLKDGYATGRVGINAGSHHRPMHRGVRLRSCLEHAVVQILERELGTELGQGIAYEQLRFQYVNVEGETRTYIPDFYDVQNDTVIEVKPHYLSIRESQLPKVRAVLDAGHKFRFFTEKDVIAWCEGHNARLIGKRFEIEFC